MTTALIIVASLTLIVVGLGLWRTKHWQFERAFFVALLGVTLLAFYAISKHNEDTSKHETLKREQAIQQANRETNEKIVNALIIGCQETYKDLGEPVNATHAEIRRISNAAAKDAMARLKNENLTTAQRVQAQRSLRIWGALTKAARPVPKKDCSLAVPKELRPIKKGHQ